MLNILAHLVVKLVHHSRQLSMKINVYTKVQISTISCVWFDMERSKQFFALLDCQVVVQVEDSLLPVSIA